MELTGFSELTNEQLTSLLWKKAPAAWLPVDDANRNTAIALLIVIREEETEELKNKTDIGANQSQVEEHNE